VYAIGTGVGHQTISRYPFRAEAQEWIRGQGVSLSDVLTSPAYGRIVKAGLQRVQEALTEEGIKDWTAQNDVDALISVLSYPVARMLVSSVGDLLLIRRYALREAKAAYEHLVHEDVQFLLELGQGELGMPASLEEGEGEAVFHLHFTDYLRNASAIRDRTWKLHNQDLRGGYVRLDKRRFARLLQEAMRRRIESELPLEVTEGIHELLADEIEEVVKGVEALRSTIQRESYGEFSMDFMPPCMLDLLEKTQQGVNVPHMGRFALTALLSHVGLDVDDIIDLFRVSSDFKESIASYQVRHVTGDVSGTRYTPPSCATMLTYGICLRDKRCEQAGSPRRYYFRRQRQAERESGKEAPPPEGPEDSGASGGSNGSEGSNGSGASEGSEGSNGKSGSSGSGEGG
jgi:DNA primase large subunit